VGIFGSLLVLILVPAGVAVTRLFDAYPIQMDLAFPMIPIGMLVVLRLQATAVKGLARPQRAYVARGGSSSRAAATAPGAAARWG
jgi:putative effector of murein hydrolase LrgA (UPF0299 family)